MACNWSLLFISVVLQMAVAHNPELLPPQVIARNGQDTCPPQEVRDAAKQNIDTAISDILRSTNILIESCGAGRWHRVAFLNMSDPMQQCPSAWREYNSNGIRVCARQTSSRGSCQSTHYPTDRQYSRVCGRIIGYQLGSPGAFELAQGRSIDQAYLDGISITHGTPRTHVWSYAVGASENGNCLPLHTCPCSNSNRAPPPYVGNNYYCESAYRGDCFVNDVFFPNDPLWDGQQCDNEGTCCTGTNTPPWFSVDLADRTGDDIEVRICHDENTSNEDSPIQLLELYVQ